MEFELAPYVFSSPSKDECSKFLAKGTPILSQGQSTLLLKFTKKKFLFILIKHKIKHEHLTPRNFKAV